MSLLALGLYVISTLVIAATLLPFWRTHRWWVRLCDFPRFQVAILGLAIVVSLPLVRWPLSMFEILLTGAVATSVLWQLSWIWRYFPGGPKEVLSSSAAPPNAATCISLLTINVFQKAREAGALINIIFEADPDVVFAVETDEWWCSLLTDALRSRYPYTLIYPLSNGYGLALFSRLELVEPTIRFLIDEAIPSIKTGIRLRSGSVIDLYGMHPQPPAPHQDSAERDSELLRVAKEVGASKRPSIVLGDLNDVAWSRTTSDFKEAGGLLDPRRGRGFFNTFPAAVPGLRYPLDYIFHSPHFAVGDMRVLPRCQSDHLPLIAKLCIEPATRDEKK